MQRCGVIDVDITHIGAEEYMWAYAGMGLGD